MFLIKALQYITHLVNQGEETVITFVSTFLPWIVPLVPAYTTYSHAIKPNELNFPPLIALAVGASVEGLGLTSMYRMFQMLEHNRKYKDAKQKSPWWIPAMTYLMYLAIVLSVNVVMDYSTGVPWDKLITIGLLSVLSVPAGILIATTAIHNERVLEHQKVLAERRENRKQNRENRSQVPEPVPQNRSGSGEPASRFREQIWGILEQHWEQQHEVATTAYIADKLNLDKHRAKSYIWGQRNEWMTARGIAQG